MDAYKYQEHMDVVNRAIKGLASDEELAATVAAAAAELEKIGPETDVKDIADLLVVLWYATDTSYQGLIEPYLRGPDTLLAEVALSGLCNFYGLAKQYTEQIQEFIKGVPWDPFGDLQILAIQMAKEHLVEQG